MAEKQHKNISMIKKFLPYYRPYLPVVMLDLLCAALTTVCEMVFPLIIKYITNQGINSSQGLLLETVLKLGGLYLFLRIVDVIANYYMAFVGHVMGTKIETDMRKDLFAHLQKLSFSYYDNTKIGQIMARVTSDLFEITEFAHHCPEEFFIAGIKIIGSFVILGRINLLLTAILFAMLPLMFLFSFLYNKKMRSGFKAMRVQVGELNAQVEDSLLGIRVVQSFANEDIEREKFNIGNIEFYNAKKLAYRYMAAFQSGTRFCDGLMYLGVIVAGSIFIINGLITSFDLVAYLLYITTLLTSVRRIVEFTEQFQRGMTGIERFAEIMEQHIDIKDKPDAVELKNVAGNISFENVSFKYADNLENVLENINLEIKQGDNIALVGPSGGGKTTLCSLLPRFYDVTSGRILIDGNDIRSIKLKSLRSNIGVVQQDVYLFSGTVYDNIEYGKPGASRDEVIEAAKKAGAHEFIISLPQGYDTYVGERGVKLSGGQKQRISIARLFLKNPPILILDEATSALDNESELLVQQSLEKLAANRTTFTIAHRLTTIRNATKILVLDETGIAEQGTHDELMSKNGVYSKLYGMYSKP
ncbi:MAG TPA: thiamine ABC transporter permease [Ruminococcaceae bacterium]|nr:thiamine ABC transporter permease [Oscillospiraceae bacterium]